MSAFWRMLAVICSILEQQAIRIRNKEVPNFPLWLAPIQVRIIPVSEKHHEFCESLLERIPFRVDFDDRDMSVGKKIRESGRHWVPYTLVVGDREVEGDELTVRIHGGEQKQISLDQLNELIKQETAGMPTRPLNVPVRLSERPIFVG